MIGGDCLLTLARDRALLLPRGFHLGPPGTIVRNDRDAVIQEHLRLIRSTTLSGKAGGNKRAKPV